MAAAPFAFDAGLALVRRSFAALPSSFCLEGAFAFSLFAFGAASALGFADALAPSVFGFADAPAPSVFGFADALAPSVFGFADALAPSVFGFADALAPSVFGLADALAPSLFGFGGFGAGVAPSPFGFGAAVAESIFGFDATVAATFVVLPFVIALLPAALLGEGGPFCIFADEGFLEVIELRLTKRSDFFAPTAYLFRVVPGLFVRARDVRAHGALAHAGA